MYGDLLVTKVIISFVYGIVLSKFYLSDFFFRLYNFQNFNLNYKKIIFRFKKKISRIFIFGRNFF